MISMVKKALQPILPFDRKQFILFTATLLIPFVFFELGLRVFMPGLGLDVFGTVHKSQGAFLYGERFGYKYKPYSLVPSYNDKGALTLEQVNNEGFRGPDCSVEKPNGVFRILLLGDSIALGLTVPYKNSWEQVLEIALNRRAALFGQRLRYEIINAGMGGYVSRQVLVRLLDVGLKYQPDLVLILVGSNDMVYSTLPYWDEDFSLVKIEKAYIRERAESEKKSKKSLWSMMRMLVYRYSYIARLVRQVRNNMRNAWYINNLIRKHQVNSGVEFNARALELYKGNLEEIYRAIKAGHARMGLVVWPCILSEENFGNYDINKKMTQLYSCFELSGHELWQWYKRYVDAQRGFASGHQDIILSDACAAFALKNQKERLGLFTDLVHLTVDGNRLLAEAVLDSLIKDKIVQ